MCDDALCQRLLDSVEPLQLITNGSLALCHIAPSVYAANPVLPTCCVLPCLVELPSGSKAPRELSKCTCSSSHLSWAVLGMWCRCSGLPVLSGLLVAQSQVSTFSARQQEWLFQLHIWIVLLASKLHSMQRPLHFLGRLDLRLLIPLQKESAALTHTATPHLSS